jgi:hypothetical protein
MTQAGYLGYTETLVLYILVLLSFYGLTIIFLELAQLFAQ